jgi:acetyltransferase-like isoleucine patch superfamily enzyme
MRNKLNFLWLRAKDCLVDWTAWVRPCAVVELSGSSISIGPRTSIDRGAIVRAMGGDITISTDCSVNAHGLLSGSGGIRTADSMMMASHVSIYAAHHLFAGLSVPMNKQMTAWSCIDRTRCR